MASSTPDNLPNTVVGLLALIGLAVTIGAADSLLRPVQLQANWSAPAGQNQDIDAAQDPVDTTGATQPREQNQKASTDSHLLNLQQAHDLFNEGEAIFLDARRRDEFDKSHILGAMHLSTESIADGTAGPVLDELLGLGTDYPLILYCHGGDCDASENTAIRLQQMGFTNIRIMQAGFDEWVNAGYEVESP